MVSTRIYAREALLFGGEPAIDDLILAGYDSVIVGMVYVAVDGTLLLNRTQIVSKGVYKEAERMDLPSRLARLRRTSEIIFAVYGGNPKWGPLSFKNIKNLLQGPGAQQLYDNFKALKDAMVSAGGDIDAVDFDAEDDKDVLDSDVMVNFGLMLGKIGFKSVTLCPFYVDSAWTETFKQLRQKRGKNFVSAIHLQCYDGGRGNSPKPWAEMIKNDGGGCLLIPGLATNQPPDGWWDENNHKPGGSVVKTQGVAIGGSGDWSRMLRKANYATADDAIKAANAAESFFFYCREAVSLGNREFQKGDAVYFSGLPDWWEYHPQCDAYSYSSNCSNIYNDVGACPDDLRNQYANWKQELSAQKLTLDGGFIWFYDSVMSCLLAGCCGWPKEPPWRKEPGIIANYYQEAIIAGLS
jgi:hypothetical protein